MVRDMEMSRFIDFMEMSPNGKLLLDSDLNVVYANRKLSVLFEGEKQAALKQFGNLFKCENAAQDENGCGTHKQCSNCPIRSSALVALSENRPIENVQVIRTFVVALKKKTRWFNMAFTPVELDQVKYLWVSLIDLSEMMNYKVEKYLNQSLLEDEILFDKGQFHENTINAIEHQLRKNGSLGLLLITCEVEPRERGTFDKLWLNKQLEAYHHVLVDKIEKSERVCRYDSSRYLLFTAAETSDAVHARLTELKVSLEAFEGQISLAMKKMFSYRAIVVSSMGSPSNLETESVDIAYFKWLSTLESQEVKQFITIFV